MALAVELGMGDFATKMLRNGHVDAVAKTSALLAAIASTNENTIQLLMTFNVDINKGLSNDHLMTPLCFAVKRFVY